MWPPISPLDYQQTSLHLGSVPAWSGTLVLMGDPEILILGELGVNLSQLGTTRDNGCLPILGTHYHVQHHRLGRSVLKYKEVAVMVGDGGEVVGEGRRDCAGMVNDVQSGCTYCVALQERELGGYICDVKVSGGFIPYSYSSDFRGDSLEIWGVVMGVVIFGRFLGGGGSVAN